uniref:Uncharacterized protein n=1 Tax=Cacopsylla melanoneura TaxID=428564 RepID=A0A8D9FDK8_9HEMI
MTGDEFETLESFVSQGQLEWNIHMCFSISKEGLGKQSVDQFHAMINVDAKDGKLELHTEYDDFGKVLDDYLHKFQALDRETVDSLDTGNHYWDSCYNYTKENQAVCE